MPETSQLPRYDTTQSYRWNYEHAPDPVEIDVPDMPGDWTFCDLPVASPLGIPAGPLLNGRWILYYASLGFDVLTYKTVRSSPRECYALPNLQPVAVDDMFDGPSEVPASDVMKGSWAVSFGMPSASPDNWRADIERTRERLPQGKLLSVSVVGTIQEGWTIDDLAADYAKCARWAVESGAHCIETNFSCPNVSTCDGQLYQQPESARVVAEAVRGAIGEIPLIIKLGCIFDAPSADALLDVLAPSVNAFAMTNSIVAKVRAADGNLMFDEASRGICGSAALTTSLAQTRLFVERARVKNAAVRMIGVGGARTAENIRNYLATGAESVQIATAAMVDPSVAIRIREDFAAHGV